MEYYETRVYKFVCHVYGLSTRAVRPYSSKFSKKTYTQNQHVAVLCLKERFNLKFYEVEELLLNSPTLCEALGLTQVQDHTTLCKALKRLRAVVFRLLLISSGGLFPSSGRTGIDATGFDRRHASKHYVQRSKMRLESMKTTYLVDTETLMILGVHNTVTRKHDTRILLPLLEDVRKHFPVKVLCADKGYDSKKIRDTLRKQGVRPLIKHREFKPLDKAHNARMNQKDVHQRAMNETVNSTTKRKYSDTLTTKTYWNQTKETLIKAITYNIDRYITKIKHTYKRISIKLFSDILSVLSYIIM